jgi:hypothetical protein
MSATPSKAAFTPPLWEDSPRNGAAPPPSVKPTVERIGPDRAELLLGKMMDNRRLRSGKITQFAADMRAGRWRVTGEAIKIDKNGAVIDGEHRLRALIEAGRDTPDVEIETVVVYGVAADDRVAMDSGTARTLADHLQFLGVENATGVAAALNVFVNRHSSSPTAARTAALTASRQELVDVYYRNPGLSDSVRIVRRAVGANKIPMGLAAALHYDMATLDGDDADAFWDLMYTGYDLPEGSPLLALRRRLQENAISNVGKLQPRMIHALIIKAWNAWRAGDALTTMRWRQGGSKPEAFPTLR